MAIIEQTYNIDLVPNGMPLVVNVSQYDVGSRALTFNFFKDTVAFAPPIGYAAHFSGTKPDGTGFMYAMTVSGSSATVEVTQQMTAVAGDCTCEIRLIDGSGNVLGTANFTLAVEQAAMDDDTVISDSDIPYFEELAQQAAESAASASASAISADQSARSIHGIPTGGSAGQVIAKTSGADYAIGWSDAHGIPAGGSAGQVLMKSSGDDYATGWDDVGGENLIVTLTYTAGVGYTADHTYDEIKANIDDGCVPYVVYSGYTCHLYRVTSQQILFAYTGMVTNIFTVSSTNSWAFSNTKPSAANTTYSNTTSGLTATTVQAAIDELKALIDSL